MVDGMIVSWTCLFDVSWVYHIITGKKQMAIPTLNLNKRDLHERSEEAYEDQRLHDVDLSSDPMLWNWKWLWLKKCLFSLPTVPIHSGYCSLDQSIPHIEHANWTFWYPNVLVPPNTMQTFQRSILHVQDILLDCAFTFTFLQVCDDAASSPLFRDRLMKSHRRVFRVLNHKQKPQHSQMEHMNALMYVSTNNEI